MQINRVTNGNIYVNGNDYRGKVMELTLPEVQAKMADHSALGMTGVTEFFAGFEKMEATLKWSAIYKDVLATIADFTKTNILQVLSQITNYEGGSVAGGQPVVITLGGQFKSVPPMNFKQNENVELESKMTVQYYKLEIDGDTVLEVDTVNNIYSVNGEDLLAQFRTNTGG